MFSNSGWGQRPVEETENTVRTRQGGNGKIFLKNNWNNIGDGGGYSSENVLVRDMLVKK